MAPSVPHSHHTSYVDNLCQLGSFFSCQGPPPTLVLCVWPIAHYQYHSAVTVVLHATHYLYGSTLQHPNTTYQHQNDHHPPSAPPTHHHTHQPHTHYQNLHLFSEVQAVG